MADANILGALTSANASNFVTHYRHFYISSSTFYSYTCIFNYIWLNFEKKIDFLRGPRSRQLWIQNKILQKKMTTHDKNSNFFL